MIDLTHLLRTEAYIDGSWTQASGGKTFAVTNPATGETLAAVADCAQMDAERAVEAAHKAFKSWSKETAQARGVKLRRWAQLISDNLEELSLLLTAEQGKPLAEARAEVKSGVESIEWAAEQARRAFGDIIPPFKQDTQILVMKQPVGVVAAITPWNFPSGMITRKVGPALAAGCAVVLKPAEDTPLSALALAALAEEAGIPPGVLNIVPCSGDAAPAIGKVLTTHKLVSKISFTGSTEVGKILMKQGADTIKRISLELGGNAPFIVFSSADLDLAVAGAMTCKFRNAGQTCVCANRILVQADIHDEFVKRLAEKIGTLVVGAGDKDGVQIGPLINEQGVIKVEEHVANALASGASLICGGKRQEPSSLFYEPTLLSNMSPEMVLFADETFGPVAGIFKFQDEAEAIRLANDSRFGLASYFYSRDLGQCFRVSQALEYGMVAVNEPIIANAAIPFGGMKESGLGREGSVEGFEEFLETKYVLIGGLT
jgi:succinate-semialdehyde dehydrogenase/glutarate-semialdehyde dehydrogenase